MQPFRWPCGSPSEEGRRQVDIWPVCYCEFQILRLSRTPLLEFFNLGFLSRFTQGAVAALHSPFPDLHAFFTVYQKKKNGRGKKKVHLTDSRARLKFHFNVRLHVGWLVGENGEEAGESPFAAISFTDECWCHRLGQRRLADMKQQRSRCQGIYFPCWLSIKTFNLS